MNAIEHDEEALARWCARHGVDLVILHGSRTAGRDRKNSDLDLAFLFAAGQMDARRFDQVAPELYDIFPSCNLDLVCLNGAGSLLSLEVAHKGKVLWARDEDAWPAFVSLAIRRYADEGKLRRRRNRASRQILERLGRHEQETA